MTDNLDPKQNMATKSTDRKYPAPIIISNSAKEEKPSSPPVLPCKSEGISTPTDCHVSKTSLIDASRLTNTRYVTSEKAFIFRHCSSLFPEDTEQTLLCAVRLVRLNSFVFKYPKAC